MTRPGTRGRAALGEAVGVPPAAPFFTMARAGRRVGLPGNTGQLAELPSRERTPAPEPDGGGLDPRSGRGWRRGRAPTFIL